MKRSSVALLSSASVLTLFLGAAVPATSAYALSDAADCEDGECFVGTPPTEGPSVLDDVTGDNESGSASEGGDSSADDSEGSESGSGSEAETFSDRRLKRDIRLLTTLDNGIRLYAFRYLWSEEVHVGVMAQDLLADPRYADAAIMTDTGTYVVDYARLGLRMATLDAWHARGAEAVMLRPRPSNRLASLAMAAR